MGAVVTGIADTFRCQMPGCYTERPYPRYRQWGRGIYCSRRCSMLAAGMKRRGTFDLDENSNEECPDVG